MNTETFTQQYPAALVALAAHMHEHRLPVPMSIDTDLVDRSIQLFLLENSHAAWLASVDLVEDEHNEYRPPRPGMLEPYFRTTWTVRISGIQFNLRSSRPLPFAVVTA